MKKMSPDEIRQQFEKAAVKEAASIGRAGPVFAVMLDVIADLQENGLDVAIEPFPGGTQLAFALKKGSVVMPLSGIIKAGGGHYLYGICVTEDQQSCQKLYLSTYDIRHQHDDKISAISYDFSRDDAAVSLQLRLIERCARGSIMMALDKRRVIEGKTRLTKKKPHQPNH